MDKNRYIYIMISKTPTKFASVIRKFGKTAYNHTAVALDENLDQLYAFARPQHNAVLLGRLVAENIQRYTLNQNNAVEVVIFRIPVTQGQYQWVKLTIEKMMNDSEYIYNLFSVLTYPVTKGFSTYKAFSCIEFAAYILKNVGYGIDSHLHRYKPDDLLGILSDKVLYSGNLLSYKEDDGRQHGYFAPMTMILFLQSLAALEKLIARLFIRRK